MPVSRAISATGTPCSPLPALYRIDATRRRRARRSRLRPARSSARSSSPHSSVAGSAFIGRMVRRAVGMRARRLARAWCGTRRRRRAAGTTRIRARLRGRAWTWRGGRRRLSRQRLHHRAIGRVARPGQEKDVLPGAPAIEGRAGEGRGIVAASPDPFAGDDRCPPRLRVQSVDAHVLAGGCEVWTKRRGIDRGAANPDREERETWLLDESDGQRLEAQAQLAEPQADVARGDAELAG